MNKYKVSLGYTLLLVLGGSVITFFTKEYLQSHVFYWLKNHNTNSVTESNTISKFEIDRLGGYKLIKPILYAEPSSESEKYAALKSLLTNHINEYLTTKKLISASVYLRDFEQGEWMNINENETYSPGSLLKMVGLFTYLKMSETKPGLLNKQVVFDSPTSLIPEQTYNSKHIVHGKVYTVRELLRYMISYSDNNATSLLSIDSDMKIFNKIFTDLKLKGPEEGNTDYKMTAKDYSVFFKVLYNASYLTKENSEFALQLLGESDFKLGMVKGIPENTLIAHKFGEMWDSTSRQLHESGIIYANNSPYILTIMTKGQNSETLPEVISGISKEVYSYLKSKVEIGN